MKFYVTDSNDGFTTFEADIIEEVAAELAYDHERYGLDWQYCTATDDEECALYYIYPDGAVDVIPL
mgnify:CR=1 FL=1